MPVDIKEAMASHGIECHDPIIQDGTLHRFANGGRGNKDAWYVLHEHGGAFGDWKRGMHQAWKAGTEHLTSNQKKHIQEEIAVANKQREEERTAHYEASARQAAAAWDKLSESGASEYLERKQVQGFGIKYGNAAIAIALRDIDGKLWSYQKIYDEDKQPPYMKERTKAFLKGGKKEGHFHTIGSLHSCAEAYVVEGYATGASVHMATGKSVIVAFDAGNLEPVIAAIKTSYPHINLTIAADNDQWGERNIGKIKAEEAAKKHGCHVTLPCFKERATRARNAKITHPTDFNDLHQLYGLEKVRKQLEPVKPTLRSITIHDFLAMEITPQALILDPIIPKQGVCMVYAYRGIGKTHVALGIAYAVATGGSFLKWSAPTPRKVLYVDGEMPAVTMQERLARQVQSYDVEPPSSDYLRIITPDLQERGIPSISTPEGQQAIAQHLGGVELVILDNISTLCRGGRENESESWNPIQEWSLSLRKRGICVLFIHHAGKNNQQRGASKREDIMDTVISLKRPNDYESSQGARFEVHYEKSRGFTGSDAVPFEAWLKNHDWHTSEIEDNEMAKVLMLSQQGVSQRDIAQEMQFSAAKVNRLLKKAKTHDTL